MTPFLLYRIGQHDYGLWLVGTQIMFYLGLLDLGVVALLPRETAFATGRVNGTDNAAELPAIVGRAALIVIWQMPLVILAAIVAWFVMPGEWEALRQPIGLLLIAFVLLFPLRIFSAVLRGLQDLAFLGRIGIAAYLISTAVTVGLVFAGLGLYSLALGWAVLQLIISIASWQRLHSYYPGLLPSRIPPMVWPEMLGRLRQGFWVSASQTAQVLLSGTDVLILGKFFGPAATVPFACTGKLMGVLTNQPQLLIQAAGPALSQMRVSESRERLPQVCIALGQAVLILSGAVVCVVLVINQGFVIRWVGVEQYGGLPLTMLLLLGMLLRHWNVTVGYTLFSFGYEKRLCLTALLDGLVTVGGMVVLIWFYGRIGAPIGSIVGVCLISLPLNLLALSKESGMSFWTQIRPFLPWFMRFIILATAASVLLEVGTYNNMH